MKAIKSMTIFSLFAFFTLFIVLGGMNSIFIDQSAFMSNDLEIKFAKRIDDMNGEVTVGRLAASIKPWENKEAPARKVIDMNEIKKKNAGFSFNVEQEVEEQVAAVEDKAIPEPAIKEDLDLVLTGGLYGKQPLKEGVDFEGIAQVVDGEITNLQVILPDGKEFSINGGDRMVGNVFEYEDSETRELRSGLFYEIKKGTYMITLTNDTNYAGLRLEFKTEGDVQFGSDTQEQNWAMNDQNNDNQQRQEDEYQDEEFDIAQDSAQYDNYDNYGQNGYEQDNYPQDNYDNGNFEGEEFASADEFNNMANEAEMNDGQGNDQAYGFQF